jgi:hypothetical protein
VSVSKKGSLPTAGGLKKEKKNGKQKETTLETE